MKSYFELHFRKQLPGVAVLEFRVKLSVLRNLENCDREVVDIVHRKLRPVKVDVNTPRYWEKRMRRFVLLSRLEPYPCSAGFHKLIKTIPANFSVDRWWTLLLFIVSIQSFPFPRVKVLQWKCPRRSSWPLKTKSYLSIKLMVPNHI